MPDVVIEVMNVRSTADAIVRVTAKRPTSYVVIDWCFLESPDIGIVEFDDARRMVPLSADIARRGCVKSLEDGVDALRDRWSANREAQIVAMQKQLTDERMANAALALSLQQLRPCIPSLDGLSAEQVEHVREAEALIEEIERAQETENPA